MLLRGPSGAGKTALALALIEWGTFNGVFCRLVGDDQVLLTRHGNRLVATAPAAIAGLVEIRGFQPIPAEAEPRAVIDLVVDLGDAVNVPRYQPDAALTLLGMQVAALSVDRACSPGAVRAILAKLVISPAWKGNRAVCNAAK